MRLTTDSKQEVLEAVINGISRVAEAILATPKEARTKALDAAADSYRKTARALGYDEAEIKELVNAIMFRLLEEVTIQKPAHEPQDDASSLGPESAA